jgi:transcriptional regulator with XRE-family HTH domain
VADRLLADPLPQLAANVKRVRADRGLTQQAVADRGGLALSDVGRIERGERDPGIRVLFRVARGLCIQPSALLPEVDWAPSGDQSPD